MNDNQLITHVIALLDTMLPLNGQTGVEVAQGYQPTQQGASTVAALYIHKIGDHRYGFVQKSSVDNDEDFTRTETQQMETSFQVNARCFVPPEDDNAITPSDLLNLAAMILQSEIAQTTLLAQNIGIYRITDVRQLYIINDYDRNEGSPSFDFTLTHKRSIVGNTPALNSFEANIHRV